MTVIVGLVTEHTVLLAADGVASDGGGVIWPNPAKLRRVPIAGGESIVIGTCGRTAIGSIIDYRLKVDGVPDEHDDREREAWAHTVAEAITDLVKEAGFTGDDGMDGVVLMGWRRRLWEVTDALAHPIQRFAAIGAGAELALGALDVLADDQHMDPQRAVVRAVTAACRWHTSCRPPISVLVTETT